MDNHYNELVKEQLKRIIASRSFVNSPILSKFLSFVVLQKLANREHQIKEYTIAKEVLGKTSFLSHSDASVRIHAIRLRKLLAEFYDSDIEKTGIRIDVPKGSYRPTFADYNVTEPEGLSLRDTGEIIPEDSLCIVPFNGFIRESDLVFSVTGFCEYLNEKLSLFQDISVLSFQSVYKFTNEGNDFRQLNKQFGVTYYLTGSLEVENNIIKVSVQLYDAKSNLLIWSHSFDAGLESHQFIVIAEEIVVQIVSSLAGYSGYIHFRKFAANNRLPALSDKVANAVFWFYRYQVHNSEQVFYEAITYLEAAVAEDPKCSLCWAVLAHLYTDGFFYDLPTIEAPLERAQSYVTISLSINPECQHAHMVQTWLYIMLGNKLMALRSLQKMLLINPYSNFFMSTYSLGMALLGEYETSLVYYEKAMGLNPLPVWWLHVPKIFTAFNNHQYEEVIFHARKMGNSTMKYEYIFEMIALRNLKKESELEMLAHQYQKKYPDGMSFVKQALPAVIFDEGLKSMISEALTEINNTYLNGGSKT